MSSTLVIIFLSIGFLSPLFLKLLKFSRERNTVHATGKITINIINKDKSNHPEILEIKSKMNEIENHKQQLLEADEKDKIVKKLEDLEQANKALIKKYEKLSKSLNKTKQIEFNNNPTEKDINKLIGYATNNVT
ncbi:hypothetical protein [Aureivirga marina]|uniref:hypothetical protein n=1 Tax=Aureivirga marina TaxID=1182451 RepID=UPI0018CA60C1|nr:hypothetical protein [Aureivirga marina]